MKLFQKYNLNLLNRKNAKHLRDYLKGVSIRDWIIAGSAVVSLILSFSALCIANKSNETIKTTTQEAIKSQEKIAGRADTTLISVSELGIMTQNEIANSANDLQIELRRAQIKPEIRLKTKRVAIGNNEASGIVVTLQNIGTGSAKDIIVMVYEENAPNPNPFKNFYQRGTFPILQPNPARNIPLTKQTKPVIDRFYMKPIIPDTGFGQDFMVPGEELEFQYGCYEFNQTPNFFPLGFVITYFDIDGNEYTTTTNVVPGIQMQVEYNDSWPMFDSMSTLLRITDLYQYKTFFNRGLRDSTGEFKGVPKPKK